MSQQQPTLWDLRTRDQRRRDYLARGDEGATRALRGMVLAHLAKVFGCGGRVRCACGRTGLYAGVGGQRIHVTFACPHCGLVFEPFEEIEGRGVGE